MTRKDSKIYVGEEVYKIKYVKSFKDKRKRGDCDPEKKLIRVLSGMGESATQQTIIHELLHALDFEYDLQLKHKLVYALETPLYRFLVDNFSK